MNNSKIVSDNIIENPEIDLETFQIKQGELAKLIETIKRIELSTDWQELKTILLGEIASNLERQMLNEISKKEINLPRIYRLQGELAWAKKYADLDRLAEVFRRQLEGIRNQIKTWQNK